MTPEEAREMIEQALDVDRWVLLGWTALSEQDPFTRENARSALHSLRTIEGQKIRGRLLLEQDGYMTATLTLVDGGQVEVSLRLLNEE